MRIFPRALIFSFIFGLPIAGFSKDLTATVHDYVKMFEASAKKPTPSCYPELADRVRALFPVKGSRKFESWTMENGVRRQGAIIYVQGDQVEIIASEGEWNFSTDDKYVYEWKSGAKSGIRIKRVNEELVGFQVLLSTIQRRHCGITWSFFESGWATQAWPKIDLG